MSGDGGGGGGRCLLLDFVEVVRKGRRREKTCGSSKRVWPSLAWGAAPTRTELSCQHCYLNSLSLEAPIHSKK